MICKTSTGHSLRNNPRFSQSGSWQVLCHISPYACVRNRTPTMAKCFEPFHSIANPSDNGSALGLLPAAVRLPSPPRRVLTVEEEQKSYGFSRRPCRQNLQNPPVVSIVTILFFLSGGGIVTSLKARSVEMSRGVSRPALWYLLNCGRPSNHLCLHEEPARKARPTSGGRSRLRDRHHFRCFCVYSPARTRPMRFWIRSWLRFPLRPVPT
jgi:hypothetical protein